MPISPSRRNFLGLASAAFAFGGMGTARRSFAIDPIGRTRPSHLLLSIAAYSYRDFLTGDHPKMTMDDYMDIAAEMGCDAIEPTSYYFPKDVDEATLRKFALRAFKLGLNISGTAIGNNFCIPPGPARDEQFALTRGWIDRAVALRAPVIRVFGGNPPKGMSESEAARLAVEGMREVLPYAESKGVVLALENHGGITLRPEQLLALVHAVESPNFGVNLDTGNFHGEDPYADLAQLAPYAVNVQVKTEISREGKPKEDADLARFIAILREAKYSGYVALEYEAKEDPLVAIPRHIKTLRSLISA